MTQEDEIITNLSKQNFNLKKEIDSLKDEILRAEMKLSKVKVPSGFEDGNSYDDYSFNERVQILCDSYERLKNG